jgi:hypothetical protein
MMNGLCGKHDFIFECVDNSVISPQHVMPKRATKFEHQTENFQVDLLLSSSAVHSLEKCIIVAHQRKSSSDVTGDVMMTMLEKRSSSICEVTRLKKLSSSLDEVVGLKKTSNSLREVTPDPHLLQISSTYLPDLPWRLPPAPALPPISSWCLSQSDCWSAIAVGSILLQPSRSAAPAPAADPPLLLLLYLLLFLPPPQPLRPMLPLLLPCRLLTTTDPALSTDRF